jgi:plastocyanin
MRRSHLAALALAVLALGAAGCGDDDNGGDTAASTPTATPPATTQAPPATTAAPSGGASTVAVGATEFKFEPASLTAKAGTVTFDLKNNGGAPHALEIEGNGIEEASETINGGDSTQLKVDLKAGEYEIYCPVGNHRQMGMVGTLKVS